MSDVVHTNMAANHVHCAHVLVDATGCSAWTLFQTVVITLLVVFFYALSKSAVDRCRLSRSRSTVVVIGAGPVGLASALIAARSGRASRVIVFEERDRSTLIARSRQTTLSARGVRFLRSSAVGVDVVRGSGATWQHHQCALTMRAGTLVQCLLDAVERYRADGDAMTTTTFDSVEKITRSADGCDGKKIGDTVIDLRLGTKFTRDCLDELERISERIIAVVCDGAGGRSASLLGLSDEYAHHSCRAYGATATVDRPSTCFRSTDSSPVTDVTLTPSSFAPAVTVTAAGTGAVPATIAPAPGSTAAEHAVTATTTTTTTRERERERDTGSAAIEVHIHNVTIDVLTATGCSGGIGYIAGPLGGGTPARGAGAERVVVAAAGGLRKCLSAGPESSGGLCGMLMESSVGHDDPFPTGFHLKIFGDTERRCMALAVPRCESRVVRALKVVTDDQSIMRSIFQSCFNRYKSSSEPLLTESSASKYMKFSPRLFEIKLSHRMESVAYIEDANIFVVVEGDSARRLNFNTGSDMNLALTGLESLHQFIEQSACAENEQTILNALITKFRHGQLVSEEFIRHGLREVMFS